MAKREEEGNAFFQKAKSSLSTHCRVGSKATDQISPLDKNVWLHRLRVKHARKSSKGLSSIDAPISSLKFTAVPISLDPPKISNKITLSQDTITLFDPTDRSGFKASPFKITLETTLLEDRPYTICSTVLQRWQNKSLESALSHFEVLDLETGYVLSEKPLPIEPQPSHVDRPKGRKKSKKINPSQDRALISKTTCTELQPYRTSLLSLVSEPSPFKSSTQRLFDGLRIADPELLVGRSLRLRLRPSVALWSVRTMGEVFGFEEAVSGWPDLYERPLVVGCLDSSEAEAGAKGGVGADFMVLKSTGE